MAPALHSTRTDPINMPPRPSLRAAIFALLLAPFAVAWAGPAESITAAAPDKRGYTLFSPTPREQMREFNTDRPDKTESPYTVDAGHFQVELDLANFTLDRDAGVRAYTWNIAPTNFRVGLLNNVELDVIFDSYLHERIEDRRAGTTQKTSGVGDLTTRLKINLWGNDGGKSAFGIIPFVKAPTNSHGLGNDSVEGGVIFPLAVELPGGWSVGLMTEFDFLRNEDDRGYHTEFVNSITFGHDIIGNLAGYAEFFSSVSSQRSADWVGTVDVGLTYGVTKNIQLDLGANFGVTRAADDFQPFLGLSMRF